MDILVLTFKIINILLDDLWLIICAKYELVLFVVAFLYYYFFFSRIYRELGLEGVVYYHLKIVNISIIIWYALFGL